MIAAQDSGEGELIVKRQNSGKQIGVLKYHFKSTAKYTLDFKIIKNNAMSDGIQANIVEVILTGEGAGVNISGRKLNLCVTGYGTFKKSSSVKTISVTTSESGKVSIEIYDTNIDGEDITLTGVLDLNKMVKATAQIHFQNNMDCDANPPQDGIYNRTIFTYSISNQQYLLRQRECDHLVTVHKLLPEGKQGEQTSTSQKWVNYYDLMFPFVLGEDQYFFGLAKRFINMPQNTDKSFWIIAKLGSDGNKITTDYGVWDQSWDIGFAFATQPSSSETRQFIYLHSKKPDSENKYHSVIREINQNGTMGTVIDKKLRDRFIDTVLFIKGGEQDYLKVYEVEDVHDYRSRYYELSKEGKCGEDFVYHHNYGINRKIKVAFSYLLEDKTYDLGQETHKNLFFINEDFSSGIYADRVYRTELSLDKIYPYMAYFKIDNKSFFIRQDNGENHWVIQELITDGKLGSITDSRG